MFQKPSSAFQSMNEIQRPLKTLKQEPRGDSSNLGTEESLWRCRKREDKMMKLEKDNGKKEVYSGEMRDGTRAQK